MISSNPPPGGGGGCFLAGTPITMADGKTKPIEKIKVGDMVLSLDQDTGKMIPDKVTQIFSHPKENTYLIINGRLKVTPVHAVLTKGQWVSIGELKLGDTLTDLNGKDIPITSMEKVKELVDVYNFEVNPEHNYVADGFIVHNMIAIKTTWERLP